MKALIWPAINFALLLALLYKVGNKPLKDAIRARHEDFLKSYDSAKKQAAEAKEKFQKFSSKLEQMDQEAQGIRDLLVQEAKEAAKKMNAESVRLSGVIVSDAKVSAQSSVADFRGQLIRKMAGEVIDRATTMLASKMTSEEKAKLRQEFSAQVRRVS